MTGLFQFKQHRSYRQLCWLILLPWAIVGCERDEVHREIPIGEQNCVTCHRTDFDAAEQPLHVEQLPETCGNCHLETSWAPATGSDHERFFPLLFAHAEAGCSDCHQQDFSPSTTPTECVGCHLEDSEQRATVPHEGLPRACERCHSEEGFSPSRFEHEQVGYVLKGAHAALRCQGCHGEEEAVYEGTPTGCIDCHGERAETAFPPHTFPISDCNSCHGEESFFPSNFVHPWMLTGQHTMQVCTACHRDADPDGYGGLSSECVSCHLDDYNASTFPGHELFPTECEQCHSTTAW